MHKKPLLLICLIVLFFCNILQAQNNQIGQKNDIRVNKRYIAATLAEIINNLVNAYELEFVFEQSELPNTYFSEISFKEQTIEQTLDKLLEEANWAYQISPVDGKIYLLPTGETIIFDEPEVSYNIQLSGVIKDVASSETLPYAQILVKGTTNGTTTNLDGYFTLFNIPSDTSSIIIQFLGYQTQEVKLTPYITKQNVEILLSSSSEQLTEVVVLGKKKEPLMKAAESISKIKLSPVLVKSLPNLGEQDIFRSLQLLPGISGSNESSSGLYIRGGTPDQNLILYDGFTVYHVDHLFGFFSAFNTNAIKDVQLYKGGFDANYGGRLSSVMEITGKNGNENDFNATLGASLIGVNGTIEIPLNGKGSILLAGRRSFQSPLYTTIFDNFTGNEEPTTAGSGGGRFSRFETQPKSYFYDLNGKFTYRPNEKDILSLSFYNGEDDLDNSREFQVPAILADRGLDISGGNTDVSAWGNWGLSAKWSRKWSDKFYSNALVSYSNYYSERDQRVERNITRQDEIVSFNLGTYENNDLKDISLKLDNELKLTQNNQLKFGLQTTYNNIKYDYIQDDTITILDRKDKGVLATIYMQDKQTLFDNRLTLSAGLRATYYDVTNKVYAEPRVSFAFNLTDQLQLKGAWSQHYQFANRIVREDILQGSRDFWILSDDETVPISSATHYIAGLSYETKNFLFDVEAFYKDLGGLSEYTLRFARPQRGGANSDNTFSYDELFFQGSGTAKGIELLAQKKFGKYTGWMAYTLSQVQYDFPELSDELYPALHDATHEFKWVNSYKVKRWDFAATWIFATGKPYTAPTGGYEITLLDGNTSTFINVGDKNALRLPAYHRMDLSATYNFNIGESKCSLGASIFNLYNNSNTWYKEYEVLEDELIETNVNYLGITPNLFLNISLR